MISLEQYFWTYALLVRHLQSKALILFELKVGMFSSFDVKILNFTLFTLWLLHTLLMKSRLHCILIIVNKGI